LVKNKKNFRKGRKRKPEPIISRTVCEMYPAEWIQKTAKETGLIKRERKINPILLFWTLVLGIGVGAQRTLAGLKRDYEDRAGDTLGMSSFYERFSPELVKFFHQCAIHGIEFLAQTPGRILKTKLDGFKDLIIVDSTIIRLNAKLAKKWPATRTRKVAAGIKVSTIISAVADGPKKIRIFGERTHDIKTITIGPWVKDRIMLLDLGFFKYQLFDRITRNGGFFVSRLKSTADPIVTSVNRVWRGNSIDVVGLPVSEFLPRLKRTVFDADVEISFKRRSYLNHKTPKTDKFRMVCVYNEEEQKYHTYLTNIPADRLDAEDIAVLYRARWEIELTFKELKGLYRLDQMPTANPDAIEALIWVAIITMLVSRRVYLLIRAANPQKAVRFTHLRWAKLFAEKSSKLCTMILDFLEIEYDLMDEFEIYMSQALDPNVKRERLMGDLVA